MFEQVGLVSYDCDQKVHVRLDILLLADKLYHPVRTTMLIFQIVCKFPTGFYFCHRGNLLSWVM